MDPVLAVQVMGSASDTACLHPGARNQDIQMHKYVSLSVDTSNLILWVQCPHWTFFDSHMATTMRIDGIKSRVTCSAPQSMYRTVTISPVALPGLSFALLHVWSPQKSTAFKAPPQGWEQRFRTQVIRIWTLDPSLSGRNLGKLFSLFVLWDWIYFLSMW